MKNETVNCIRCNTPMEIIGDFATTGTSEDKVYQCPKDKTIAF